MFWWWILVGFAMCIFVDYVGWVYRMVAVMLSTLLGR